MAFEFDTAVTAPFRMQPGLRRMAAGALQLTPLAPGSRHQREKLAVLSAYWSQALGCVEGFDPQLALQAVYQQAARDHGDAWRWDDGARAEALHLGTAVHADGSVQQTAAGRFGLGDEVARCLHGLPAEWRQPALLALAFAEDFAILDAASGRIPWLAVCLPSHWAPEDKLGRHFAEVHAPVADNALLLKASEGLMRLVTGADRWERFVWNITDQPRLHAHPAHGEARRWEHTPVDRAFFRSEHQTFIPLPQRAQAAFTILVDVQPLSEVLDSPARAAALHAAVSTMSEAVLAYRGLTPVREPLLHWLAERAGSALAA